MGAGWVGAGLVGDTGCGVVRCDAMVVTTTLVTAEAEAATKGRRHDDTTCTGQAPGQDALRGSREDVDTPAVPLQS